MYRNISKLCVLCMALLAGGIAVSLDAAAGPYRRIVSTNLCADEYVFRLVPRDHIAALSYEATDRHPQVSTIADKAAGIRTIHPSAETILALKPDLVVMYAGTNQRLRATLKQLHIDVLDVPWADSLADIRSATMMLGDSLGNPAAAKALLAAMDAKLAAARAAAPHGRVRAILYQPNGYARVSGYADEILAIAGGDDMAPALLKGARGTLPVETVVAAAPDLLILGGESEVGSALAYRVLHHPALQTLQGRSLMRFQRLPELLCAGPWAADAVTSFTTLVNDAAALRAARLAPPASGH